MKVLILGASGLVGGNCFKHFTSLGHSCIGTYFSFKTPETVFFNTLDPNDPRNADLDVFNPDAIVHCGALTWVDYCEEHVEESYEKTVRSTHNAVLLAKRFNAAFVYLSTDYVFDGQKGFYLETDRPNPLCVYGAHKLEAEKIVQSQLSNHLICRITNVYGDEVRGKNFVARLAASMAKGEQMKLELPYDQYATPTNAFDIARAIALLLKHKKSGVYHFAGTDYMNRVQLAQRIVHHFGGENLAIHPVATDTLKQPAKRPLNGGMSAAKFNAEFPDFRWSNVDDYLLKIKSQS